MVAYLANGFFYNQLHEHWFWTLVTFARVMRHTAIPAIPKATATPIDAPPMRTPRLVELLKANRAVGR